MGVQHLLGEYSATAAMATSGPRSAVENVGQFVRTRRLASRISQKELGELAGVGTRFISELERGKPTLRMDAIAKVLAVFNKTLGVCDPSDREPGA